MLINLPRIPVLVCAAAGAFLAIQSACADQYALYKGKLGKSDISLVLQAKNEDGEISDAAGRVTGTYYFDATQKDVFFQGDHDGHNNITLSEAGSKVTPGAKIKAHFEPDSKDKTEKNARIVGTWQSADGKQTLPLQVELFTVCLGEGGDGSTPLVERSARTFRNAVIEHDRATVAKLIQYPINVWILDKKHRIRNQAELLAKYDAIFTRRYCAAIKASVPHDLFSNYQGSMLGAGIVWIDQGGKIKALNNTTDCLVSDENERKQGGTRK